MHDEKMNCGVPDWNECNCQDTPRFCPPPKPGFCPQPPVPSVVQGMSLYEAMQDLSNRVNVCIDTYNHVMAENYRTLRNLEKQAEENGAYYSPCDVYVEEGYSAEESATYKIIHKKVVDRRGEPIRLELHFAYNNTTNSKIEQDINSASKIEFADKIFIAQPKTDKGWYGNVIWHGAPLPSDTEATLYSVGFTRSGQMKVYSNSVTADRMISDGIENSMGCSGVLVQNGEITDKAWYENIPNYDIQSSRILLGQNFTTQEVMIFVTGKENEESKQGMTSLRCAQILKDYGCNLVVEIGEGLSAGAMDKGSLMFTPEDKQMPNAYAFWYISRKCYYRNDYERELAELVQNYGACIWQGYLNKENILDLRNDLNTEIEERKNADSVLQENIDNEQARAEEAERVLQENIDKEQQRAEEAEDLLDKAIKAEEARADAAEKEIQANLDKETKERQDADTLLSERINAEQERAEGVENQLRADLTTETNERKTADNELNKAISDEKERALLAESTLQSNINQEKERAMTAEGVLKSDINTETNRAQKAEQDLQDNIDAERLRAETAENELETKVSNLTIRVETLETNVGNLQTLTNNLQEQMTALDATVSSLSNLISNIETALNNVKTDINNLKVEIANIKDGTLELPYIKKVDGEGTGTHHLENLIVSGDLNTTDLEVTGSATVPPPSGDNDAVNKKYVADNYLNKITGGRIGNQTANNINIIPSGLEITNTGSTPSINIHNKDNTSSVAIYYDINKKYHILNFGTDKITMYNSQLYLYKNNLGFISFLTDDNERALSIVTNNHIYINAGAYNARYQIKNIADGTESNDAVNVTQLKSYVAENAGISNYITITLNTPTDNTFTGTISQANYNKLENLRNKEIVPYVYTLVDEETALYIPLTYYSTTSVSTYFGVGCYQFRDMKFEYIITITNNLSYNLTIYPDTSSQYNIAKIRIAPVENESITVANENLNYTYDELCSLMLNKYTKLKPLFFMSGSSSGGEICYLDSFSEVNIIAKSWNTVYFITGDENGITVTNRGINGVLDLGEIQVTSGTLNYPVYGVNESDTLQSYIRSNWLQSIKFTYQNSKYILKLISSQSNVYETEVFSFNQNTTLQKLALTVATDSVQWNIVTLS